jgi:hypothetical protein
VIADLLSIPRRRWRSATCAAWPQAQMPDTPEKLAEHYRKLAAEKVAMAKVALTNEARARHYAKAAEYWKLANTAQDRDGR